MSTPVIPVGEMFDSFNEGLKTSIAQNPPYGFVHLDDFTTSPNIGETRMSAIQYVGVIGFCGKTTQPTTDARPNFEDELTVAELSEAYGNTHIGGLGGFILSKAAQHDTMISLGYSRTEDLRYSIRDKTPVLDSGLGSGFMVMGMMAQRGLEAIERSGQVLSDDEKLATLEASLGILPVAFAKMSNNDNKKTEILYGLRTHGSYDAESARYELYQNDEDEFGIELTEEGLVAQNFHKVMKVVDTQKKCPATSHPVFITAWQQICKNTLQLAMEPNDV